MNIAEHMAQWETLGIYKHTAVPGKIHGIGLVVKSRDPGENGQWYVIALLSSARSTDIHGVDFKLKAKQPRPARKQAKAEMTRSFPGTAIEWLPVNDDEDTLRAAWKQADAFLCEIRPSSPIPRGHHPAEAAKEMDQAFVIDSFYLAHDYHGMTMSIAVRKPRGREDYHWQADVHTRIAKPDEPRADHHQTITLEAAEDGPAARQAAKDWLDAQVEEYVKAVGQEESANLRYNVELHPIRGNREKLAKFFSQLEAFHNNPVYLETE